MAEQNAPLTISLIKQAADTGDQESIDSISEAGSAMGHGFASLINIFNPVKIILGGPLSSAGSYLLPAIMECVDGGYPTGRPADITGLYLPRTLFPARIDGGGA